MSIPPINGSNYHHCGCCDGWQCDEHRTITERLERQAQSLTDRQPMPILNGHPCIQDLVIQDIEARKQTGIQKYGTPLQPFNGRDALVDLYQELLDAVQYIRQVLEERDRQ